MLDRKRYGFFSQLAYINRVVSVCIEVGKCGAVLHIYPCWCDCIPLPLPISATYPPTLVVVPTLVVALLVSPHRPPLAVAYSCAVHSFGLVGPSLVCPIAPPCYLCSYASFLGCCSLLVSLHPLHLVLPITLLLVSFGCGLVGSVPLPCVCPSLCFLVFREKIGFVPPFYSIALLTGFQSLFSGKTTRCSCHFVSLRILYLPIVVKSTYLDCFLVLFFVTY
jgi:hypothetical protein